MLLIRTTDLIKSHKHFATKYKATGTWKKVLMESYRCPSSRIKFKDSGIFIFTSKVYSSMNFISLLNVYKFINLYAHRRHWISYRTDSVMWHGLLSCLFVRSFTRMICDNFDSKWFVCVYVWFGVFCHCLQNDCWKRKVIKIIWKWFLKPALALAMLHTVH